MANILKDPRAYVKDYLEMRGITVNERGELKAGKSSKTNNEIFDTLFLDYVTTVGAHNTLQKEKAPGLRDNVVAHTEIVMKKALDELISNKKADYRTEVINSLSYDAGTSDADLKKFCKAILGHDCEDLLAVLSHWIWQVKRKMNDESVVYHIMPIFYGKQGGGKTEAIKKLYKPLQNFTLGISLSQMTDDRNYKAMSENYIIFFDEMQGCARTDIDALKRQITTDYNDYRPMRTNDIFKVRQACSFIGATNRSVAEQIIDSTGMRRFYEAQCQDKLDWDALQEIDYVSIWKCIDENKAEGYIVDRIESISESQKDLIAEDEIGLFIETRGLEAGKNPTKKIPSSELFEDYRTWAMGCGFTPKSIVWFGRAFSGKGFKKGKARDGAKTYNYFEVNHDYKAPNTAPAWSNEIIEIEDARKALKKVK